MKSTLPPSARVSGGTPAGMPDFAPLNVRMDRGELSASELAEIFRPPRPALFNVWVDWVGRGRVPVGPKCPAAVAQALAAAIRAQIELGRERIWRDPQVIPV